MVQFIEALILFLQVLVVYGQLQLSRKMNQQELQRNKGYFLIRKTNIPHLTEGEKHYRDYFDLTIPLHFYVSGSDDILVSSSEIHVNGHIIRNPDVFNPVFFTRDERFDDMTIDIPLTDEERDKKELSISICLVLQNTVGYQYNERIEMKFEKQDNPENWWKLTGFNLLFPDK